MIWAHFIFTFLFKISVKNTPMDFSLQHWLFQSDSHFILRSTTYLLSFKTRPVNQIAPMMFHSHCCKERPFHAALMCNLPTCCAVCCRWQPSASPLSSHFHGRSSSSSLHFKFRLLPARVHAGSRRLRFCAEWYMGFSECLKASIEHLEGRDMIGADMSTLVAVSLTWNYTRVNHRISFCH